MTPGTMPSRGYQQQACLEPAVNTRTAAPLQTVSTSIVHPQCSAACEESNMPAGAMTQSLSAPHTWCGYSRSFRPGVASRQSSLQNLEATLKEHAS